jgi:RNA polymerase sigma-54 factor
MRPALQLRLGNQLSLTPQLKQAIKLLAMSNLELDIEISQMLESNPVLEPDDDFDSAPNQDDCTSESDRKSLDLAAECLTRESTSERDHSPENPTESASDSTEPPDFETSDSRDDGGADLDVAPSDSDFGELRDMAELRDWGAGGGETDEESGSFEGKARAETTLREHLRWQLALTPLGPRDRLIAEVLIDSVEDDGYLREPIDYQRAALAPEVIVSPIDLEIVRKRLMRFDPVGVLARSLSECLIVQLQNRIHPRRSLAIALVESGVELLAKADRDKLARLHEVEASELSAALQLIRELNPRPGSGFYVASDEYVIPDVDVRKRAGVWEVRLNRDAMPRVRVGASFDALAARAKRDDASYIRTQMADAKQLIKSLAQREDTVLRVAQAIVREQQKFFDFGIEYMKPLVLRQIAEQCELHESTVSRVTTRKYMHTPKGLFEFKHFFSSGVATRDGGEASATAISEMIRKLIELEDQQKPLSDSALTELLKARGVMVARRTVAKYREGLSIASSTERVRL